MLHEILLSLSGHHSPLLQQATENEATREDENLLSELSPPERALLRQIARTSELHIRVKNQIDKISTVQTSVICRAVASTITSVHIRRFRQKVLDVESAILRKDAAYVGGYAIVPLSKVVGEFSPWTRRLEWLSNVVQFILTGLDQPRKAYTCSGAAIIDYLRRELQTGYEDIQEMAVSLAAVAEMAWLRQLASWLLYGKIAAFSEGDFFVIPIKHTASSSSRPEFTWDPKLVPEFVSTICVQSILFIGRSVNHIRYHSATALNVRTLENHLVDRSMDDLAMISTHLEYLKALTFPISAFTLSSTISSIRLSISQNALSQLLPLPRVLEILDVLHEFHLLGRGEFAVCLVSSADRQVNTRHRDLDPAQPVRRAGRLDNIAFKEGEVASALKQTWSELASLQDDDGVSDSVLELGRELLRFSTSPIESSARLDASPAIAFASLLFPIATSLTISITFESPLRLFLSDTELQDYAVIHAYLITIRRADMHLSSLWKMTPMRRNHPCPLGPPMSSTSVGRTQLASKRLREASRTQKMRRYWATTGKVLFVMSELGGYFQGEVIKNHWEHLQDWIQSLRAEQSLSARGSRPGTASSYGAAKVGSHFSLRNSRSSQEPYRNHTSAMRADPATIAQAHQVYLRSLTSNLLLTNLAYISTLQELLTSINHWVALFGRLLPIQQGLDLQEDSGVMDSLANYAADEEEVFSEMERSRTVLEEQITTLVQRIREVDEQRANDDLNFQPVTDVFGELSFEGGAYVPWNGRTIDRLTMRLEFLAGNTIAQGPDDDDVDEHE